MLQFPKNHIREITNLFEHPWCNNYKKKKKNPTNPTINISILQLRTYSSYATLSLALQTHYAIVDLQKLRSI